jgi:hypothetical protein
VKTRTNIDPQSEPEAERWILDRKFPLEKVVRLERLLKTRLLALGFTNVQVSFDANKGLHIRVE